MDTFSAVIIHIMDFLLGSFIIHMPVGYYQFKCCALTCFDVFTLYVYIFNETWYLAELFRED